MVSKLHGRAKPLAVDTQILSGCGHLVIANRLRQW